LLAWWHNRSRSRTRTRTRFHFRIHIIVDGKRVPLRYERVRSPGKVGTALPASSANYAGTSLSGPPVVAGNQNCFDSGLGADLIDRIEIASPPRRFWKNAPYPSPSGSEQWAVCSGQFAQPAARCASLPFLPVRVVRVVRGSNLAPPWSLRSPQLCVRYLRFQSSAHCPLHTNHWHGLPGPSPYPFVFIRVHSWFKFCSILASAFSVNHRYGSSVTRPQSPGVSLKPPPHNMRPTGPPGTSQSISSIVHPKVAPLAGENPGISSQGMRSI
jgi:hypothetical protein